MDGNDWMPNGATAVTTDDSPHGASGTWMPSGAVPVDNGMQGPIAQVGKGFYDMMHQIPVVRQFMDSNPELADMANEVHDPKGFGQTLARMAGGAVGLVPAVTGGEAIAPALGVSKLVGAGGAIGLQEGAGDLQSGKGIVPSAIDAAATAGGTVVGGKILKGVGDLISKTLNPDINAQIDHTISDLYNKAVVPQVKKASVGEFNQLNANRAAVVQDIVSKTDPAQLPTDRVSAFNAVGDNQKQIFQQYDAMKQQAGGQGTQIPLAPLIQQLKAFTQNQVNLTAFPSAVAEANRLMATFNGVNSLSPSVAQDMIKAFNVNLNSYAKNFDPNIGGTVAAQQLANNYLRASLDNAISQTPAGPGYAQLKQLYGAYSQVRDEISKAAMKQINTAHKTNINWMDIVSADQLTNGLIHLSTGNVAGAVANIGGAAVAQGFNMARKMGSDQDLAIKNMFSNVSDLMKQKNGMTPVGNLNGMNPSGAMPAQPNVTSQPTSPNLGLPNPGVSSDIPPGNPQLRGKQFSQDFTQPGSSTPILIPPRYQFGKNLVPKFASFNPADIGKGDIEDAIAMGSHAFQNNIEAAESSSKNVVKFTDLKLLNQFVGDNEAKVELISTDSDGNFYAHMKGK